MEEKSKEGSIDAVQGQKPATGAHRRARWNLHRNSVPTQGSLSSRPTAIPIIMEEGSMEETGNTTLYGPMPASVVPQRAKAPLNRNSVPTHGIISSRATAVPTIMEGKSKEEAERALQRSKTTTGQIRKGNSFLKMKPAKPGPDGKYAYTPTRKLSEKPAVFCVPKVPLSVQKFPKKKTAFTLPPKPSNLNLACSLEHKNPPTPPVTRHLPSTPTDAENSQLMPQSYSPPHTTSSSTSKSSKPLENEFSKAIHSTQPTPKCWSIEKLLSMQLQMQEDIERKEGKEKLKHHFTEDHPVSSTSHVDCTGENPLQNVNIGSQKPLNFKDIRQKIASFLERKQLDAESGESGDSDE